MLLPSIFWILNSRIQHLKKLCISLTPKNIIHSGRFIVAAETCSLNLFPKNQIKHLKNIVDVGANVGDWTSSFLKCKTPEQVILIEPISDCAEKIRKRFAGKQYIKVEEVVVGARKGYIKFNITKDTTGSSVLKPETKMKQYVKNNWKTIKIQKIKIKTLDIILSSLSEISLLKIDVQGFEEKVLSGAFKTLKKTKFILIELNILKGYTHSSSLASVYKIMTEKNGFRLYNLGKIQRLNGVASHVDALFYNPKNVCVTERAKC